MIHSRFHGRVATRAVPVSLALLAGACAIAPASGSDPTGTTSQAFEGITGYGPPVQATLPRLPDGFYLCTDGETCIPADVNGDGAVDLVDFRYDHTATSHSTAVAVGVRDGQGFAGAGSGIWNPYFCVPPETCAVGDVNGDGKSDIVAFSRSSQPYDVWVGLSTGSSFANSGQPWSTFFCLDGEQCFVADMNGDHMADLVTFTQGSSPRVYVALSNGSSFGQALEWSGYFCAQGETCAVGDVNADGKTDVVALNYQTSAAWVALSNGASLGARAYWGSVPCSTFPDNHDVCTVSDADGDNYADVIHFAHAALNAQVSVSFSNGASFAAPIVEDSFFCQSTEECSVPQPHASFLLAVDLDIGPNEPSEAWTAAPVTRIK